jgi:hypothetical protein
MGTYQASATCQATGYPWLSSSLSKCKIIVNYPWLEYHVEDKQGTCLNDVIEQGASSLSNLHRRVVVCATIKFEK